jgi:hypothetical protein
MDRFLIRDQSYGGISLESAICPILLIRWCDHMQCALLYHRPRRKKYMSKPEMRHAYTNDFYQQFLTVTVLLKFYTVVLLSGKKRKQGGGYRRPSPHIYDFFVVHPCNKKKYFNLWLAVSFDFMFLFFVPEAESVYYSTVLWWSMYGQCKNVIRFKLIENVIGNCSCAPFFYDVHLMCI